MIEGKHWKRMTGKGALFFHIGPTEQELKHRAVATADKIVKQMANAREGKKV